MKEYLSRFGCFRTLQSKIFSLVIVCLIIPFGITYYFTFQSLKEIITRKIGESVQGSLQVTQGKMEEVLSQMMSAAMLVSVDSSIVRVLEAPGELNQYERLRITDEMIATLNSTYLYNMQFYTAIIGENGQIYSSLENQQRREILSIYSWLPEAKAAKNRFFWAYEKANLIQTGRTDPLVVVAKSIDSADGRRNIGAVLIMLAAKDLGTELGSLDGQVLLTAADGRVLYHSGEAQAGSLEEEKDIAKRMANSEHGQFIESVSGERYIINYRTIGTTGWKMAQFMPYDAVFAEIKELQNIYLVITGGIVIFFVLVAGTLSYGVTRSLRLLRRKIIKLENGNLNAGAIAIRGGDDVAELMGTYNGMLDRIKDLLQRVTNEQKQKEHLRFKMLQAQINPHFMLNTLNNIKWMAYMRRDHEVGEMISHMAVLMEASIGRGEDIVPIREEIQYIESYVMLQNIRFSGQIELRTSVPVDLLESAIVKFTLQPIIENSIIHGFQGHEGERTIEITGEGGGAKTVSLIVRDNGIGITEDKLVMIREAIAGKETHKAPERIGLLNVHERLKLHFGELYGIEIKSSEGAGTIVVITLPIHSPEGVAYV